MSILTRDKIMEEIKNGRIEIDPFYSENVKDASLELLLGNEFGIFKESEYPIISTQVNLANVEWQTAGNVYILEPQKSVIAKTKEKISLPSDIAGLLTPRGKTALLGLQIQVSTGFVQPLTRKENLFFLITNLGPAPIHLLTDSKICQLVLMQL